MNSFKMRLIIAIILLLVGNNIFAQPTESQRAIAKPMDIYFSTMGGLTGGQKLIFFGNNYILKHDQDSTLFNEKGEYIVLGDTLFLYHEKYGPSLHWLYIIPWMEYKILLEKDEMIDFANDYNSGRIMQYHSHEDERYLSSQYLTNIPREAVRSLIGKPLLPFEYQKYLLDKPITATVKMKDKLTYTLSMNVGSDDGVFEGMSFYKRGNIYYQGVVIEVTSDSCIVQDIDAYNAGLRAALEVRARRNRHSDITPKKQELKVTYKTRERFNQFQEGDILMTFDVRMSDS